MTRRPAAEADCDAVLDGLREHPQDCLGNIRALAIVVRPADNHGVAHER